MISRFLFLFLLLCWLLGTLLLYYKVANLNMGQTRTSIQQRLRGHSSIEDVFYQDRNDMRIYLLWNSDFHLFALPNYQSLESMLQVYPKAVLRHITFQRNHEKSSSLYSHDLSYNQFVKYKKRGFDIGFIFFTNSDLDIGMTLAPSYTQRWTRECCFSCTSPCNKPGLPLPFHVIFFASLIKLWRHGGMVTNYAYLFRDKLKIKQGYHLRSLCNDETNSLNHNQWKVEMNSLFIESYAQYGGVEAKLCTVSILLVLQAPRNPVATCMLSLYSDQVNDPSQPNEGVYDDFVTCAESDRSRGGVLCIAEGLRRCYVTHKLENGLMGSGFSDSDGIIEDFKDDPFEAAKSLVAIHDDNNQKNYPSVSKRVAWMGSLSVTGDWTLDLFRSNYTPSLSNFLYPDNIGSKYLRYESNKSSTIISKNEDKVTISSNITDIKPQDWRDIGKSSIFSHELPSTCSSLQFVCRPYSTTLGAVRQHLNLDITSYDTGFEERGCSPSVIVTGAIESGFTTLVQQLLRHPQLLPPLYDYQSENTQLYLFDELSSENVYNGVYRSSPANRLPHRMWKSPFVDIYDLKQTFLGLDTSHIYTKDYLAPYLIREDNPDAKLIFVVRHPVTRLYSHYIKSYSIIRKEFELVDPIILQQSEGQPETLNLSSTSKYYKLIAMYNLFRQGFDKFAELGMVIDSRFSSLRMALENQTMFNEEEHTEIYNFYSRGVAMFGDIIHPSAGIIDFLFSQSIDFPAVRHFQKVMGKDRVIVVISEDLGYAFRHDFANRTHVIGRRHLQSQLESFLNICSRKSFNRNPDNADDDGSYDDVIDDDDDGEPYINQSPNFDERQLSVDDSSLPAELRMSSEMLHILVAYFKPFIHQLSLYSDLDLQSWAVPSIFVENQLLSKHELIKTWFLPAFTLEHADVNTINDEKKGLISKLLPKSKASDVDNGYNTTLGILNVFG